MRAQRPPPASLKLSKSTSLSLLDRIEHVHELSGSAVQLPVRLQKRRVSFRNLGTQPNQTDAVFAEPNAILLQYRRDRTESLDLTLNGRPQLTLLIRTLHQNGHASNPIR